MPLSSSVRSHAIVCQRKAVLSDWIVIESQSLLYRLKLALVAAAQLCHGLTTVSPVGSQAAQIGKCRDQQE
jgi:hypothetical protein